MKKRYSSILFRKIIVPVFYGTDHLPALNAALAVAGSQNILLIGVVGIAEGESLSTAALPARKLRKLLLDLSRSKDVHILQRIRVAYKPWEELVQLVHEEQPDLLILGLPGFEVLHLSPSQVLEYPPCDILIAGGKIPEPPASVLVSLRGGPYAELSLRVGLSISRTSNARLTALHLLPSTNKQTTDAAFKGVERVLRNLPEVKKEQLQTDDPVQAILSASRNQDLLVLGTTARSRESKIGIGPVAETVLRESSKGVLLVKSRHLMPANMDTEEVGRAAISVLVDRWFAENTFHAEEFADLDQLYALKRKLNLTVSLALPALNEEQTVKNVIGTIRHPLMDRVPLLDEIVLVDSDSTDRTREFAASLGVPVYIHQKVLPQFGARTGKGEALWKSLYLTHGDIILWLDTDIVNIHPRFVFGLLGPLFLRPDIQFIKGFYRRPLKVGDKFQAGGGGRVTELTARPLLNLFFPELSGVIQPLSGEYGGRRTALENLPFSSGYGVEIGLMIDVFEKYGLGAIAQVDLQERIHHNQPLESLSKMSFAIVQAVVRRIEKRYGTNILEDINKTMKLIRYEQSRLYLEVEEIAELERPPMIGLEEYRQRDLD